MEYAAPVWITCSRKHKFNNSKRYEGELDLRIIYSHTNDMPYINALYYAAVHSLADRIEQLSCKFFKSVQEPSSCLSSLLPNPLKPSITTRLRFAKIYFSPIHPQKEDIRHLFPMALSLSNFIAIHQSILVFCSLFSISFTSVWLYRFIVLYVAVFIV